MAVVVCETKIVILLVVMHNDAIVVQLTCGVMAGLPHLAHTIGVCALITNLPLLLGTNCVSLALTISVPPCRLGLKFPLCTHPVLLANPVTRRCCSLCLPLAVCANPVILAQAVAGSCGRLCLPLYSGAPFCLCADGSTCAITEKMALTISPVEDICCQVCSVVRVTSHLHRAAIALMPNGACSARSARVGRGASTTSV